MSTCQKPSAIECVAYVCQQVSGHWAWNDVWGKQSSIRELDVGAEFVQHSSRRNCIDSMGIRLLVSQVLQRCMINMSNRQAVLVADSIFNRGGVVPGIYQAILAPGNDYRMDKLGLSDIVARFEAGEGWNGWNGPLISTFKPEPS
eukprot:Skav204645  [mRNA]  locus=scaffold3135:58420:61762:- [translate_table: standard]